MFSNTAIDVCIGLIFIYLLYSLLASILLELIAQVFSLRARSLLRAIRRMLEDDLSQDVPALLGWFSETAKDLVYFFRPFEGSPLLKQFYQHPAIRYLGESNARKKPAYIYPATFSQTMVQLLRGRGFNSQTDSESAAIRNALANNLLQMNPHTLQQMRDLFEDARQDSTQFRIQLESWFDETMNRCNDWYKRQSQVLLLMLGFGLALSFNIDTIAITKILIKDKQVREQVAQMAVSKYESLRPLVANVGQSSTATSATSATATRATTDSTQRAQADIVRQQGEEVLGLFGLGRGNGAKESPNLYPILGWLLTAFAISLGAPFWFDLLGKFVQVKEMMPKRENTRTQTTTNPNIVIKG